MTDQYSNDRNANNPFAYYEVEQIPEEKDIPHDDTKYVDFTPSGYLVYINVIAMPMFFIFLSVIIGRIQYYGIRDSLGRYFCQLFFAGYHKAFFLFLVYAIIDFLYWRHLRDKRYLYVGLLYLAAWALCTLRSIL